nr:MAG TPA: hypothetical protein [Bacteriophage sp.]
MKLRKMKKQIPADFKRELYKQYKANMGLFGKPIMPYNKWLVEVLKSKNT